MTIEPRPSDVQRLIAESDAVVAAIQASVTEALLAHKREGLPIVDWQNGRVVLVPPDEIEIDDLDDLPSSPQVP